VEPAFPRHPPRSARGDDRVPSAPRL